MPVQVKKWAEREQSEPHSAREDEKIRCSGTKKAQNTQEHKKHIYRSLMFILK